jgi:hypothetical protein
VNGHLLAHDRSIPPGIYVIAGDKMRLETAGFMETVHKAIDTMLLQQSFNDGED